MLVSRADSVAGCRQKQRPVRKLCSPARGSGQCDALKAYAERHARIKEINQPRGAGIQKQPGQPGCYVEHGSGGRMRQSATLGASEGPMKARERSDKCYQTGSAMTVHIKQAMRGTPTYPAAHMRPEKAKQQPRDCAQHSEAALLMRR